MFRVPSLRLFRFVTIHAWLAIVYSCYAAAEPPEIEGRWKIQRIEQAGQRLRFAVSHHIYRNGWKGGGFFPTRYELRPDADPKEIDLHGRDGVKPGIYRVKDGMLTICVGTTERPDRFETDGKNWTRTTYVRDEDRIDRHTPQLKGKWKVVRSSNGPLRGLLHLTFGEPAAYSNKVRGGLFGPPGRNKDKPRPAIGLLQVQLDSTVDPHVVKAKLVDRQSRQERTVYLTGNYRIAGNELWFSLWLEDTQAARRAGGPVPPVAVWHLNLKRDAGD